MRKFTPGFLVLLGYVAAWMVFISWITRSDPVAKSVVAQPLVEFGLAVCDTDMDCELYDRRNEVRL